MKNTENVMDVKLSQSVSDVSAVNPLITFLKSHRRIGAIFSVPDTTRNK
jgi:hypothetical protein